MKPPFKQSLMSVLKPENNKDFAKSDELRDKLAAMGVVLKDSKNKETGAFETTWSLES